MVLKFVMLRSTLCKKLSQLFFPKTFYLQTCWQVQKNFWIESRVLTQKQQGKIVAIEIFCHVHLRNLWASSNFECYVWPPGSGIPTESIIVFIKKVSEIQGWAIYLGQTFRKGAFKRHKFIVFK